MDGRCVRDVGMVPDGMPKTGAPLTENGPMAWRWRCFAESGGAWARQRVAEPRTLLSLSCCRGGEVGGRWSKIKARLGSTRSAGSPLKQCATRCSATLVLGENARSLARAPSVRALGTTGPFTWSACALMMLWQRFCGLARARDRSLALWRKSSRASRQACSASRIISSAGSTWIGVEKL